MSDDHLDQEALRYHESPSAGKIYTGLRKSAATQYDLTLAYSPGVAAPCRAIAAQADASFRYTGRGNLVAVISNGTAVLGLGNIGPFAAKPVMEGKAMLFKKFADIDVFDLELNADNPDEFIAAVKTLEPTFGGINLEDIRAPECFYIEEQLRKQMSIPVFHDDQHGTAIIAGAAFLNALEITGRSLKTTRCVFSGAGAAAIACAKLFVELGVPADNILMCDSKGVLTEARRAELNSYKAVWARATSLRTLEEALRGADVFVGVSSANVLKPEMLRGMAPHPIIFALANPDPEIHPDLARQARPDAIVATGRSDFPNQVNNVLGFPFIFRGALDVRATCINEAMKLAAVRAIAGLAKEHVPDAVLRAYKTSTPYEFGRDYLIPKPFDPRVLTRVAPAVAEAAVASGVARVPFDRASYAQEIERILGPERQILRQIRKDLAANAQRNHQIPAIGIPHADDPRVLRAAHEISQRGDLRLALVGPEARMVEQCKTLGIRIDGTWVRIIDPSTFDDREALAQEFLKIRQRRGMSPRMARQKMQDYNYFTAMLLQTGRIDGMVGGVAEPYAEALRPVLEVVGTEPNKTLAGIYLLVVGQRLLIFGDCTINISPSSQELAQIAVAAAQVGRRYTKDPIRVAMLSFSSFGSSRDASARKVAEAVTIARSIAPDLSIDGEMQADYALADALRAEDFPFSSLVGSANVLVFPDLSSANIAYKLLQQLGPATAMGPILVGVKRPAIILQRSAGTEEIMSTVYLMAHQILTFAS